MPAMTPLQKAVLVLASLGKDEAVRVVKSLSNRDIKKLSSSVASISKASPEEVMEVLEEFLGQLGGGLGLSPGEDWIKDIIERALGLNKAQHLLRGLGPPIKVFDSLVDIDSNSLANLIRTEHPQTQALILAHLDPSKAAGVLSLLPQADQVDIVLRVAKIGSIHPDVLSEIEEALMNKIQMMGTLTSAEAGGVDMVVEMLSIVEKKIEKSILTGVEQEDPKLAEEIKSMMFVFEDLIKLDDKSLQLILREVDSSNLVLALKAANPTIQNRVFSNISSRAAQIIREDLEAMGPVKLSDVEQAQSEIVKIALRLEEEGKISISSAGEEEYV